MADRVRKPEWLKINIGANDRYTETKSIVFCRLSERVQNGILPMRTILSEGSVSDCYLVLW